MSLRGPMLRELALGVLVLGVALLYIRAAAAIPTSFLGDAVGAGGVPLVLGWTMVGVGAMQIAFALLRGRQGTAGAVASHEAAFDRPLAAGARAAGVVALAAALLFGLEWIGYVPAVSLFLAAMLLFQGGRPTLRLGLVCALGAGALWLLFDTLLDLDLPTGRLF